MRFLYSLVNSKCQNFQVNFGVVIMCRNCAGPVQFCCAGVMRVLSGQLKPKTCTDFVRVPFSLSYCPNKVFETQCVCKARARTVQILHSSSHKFFKHYLKFACKNHVQELCGSSAAFYVGVVRVSGGQSE